MAAGVEQIERRNTLNNIPNVTIKIKLDSTDELRDTLKSALEIMKDELPEAQKELYIEVPNKSETLTINEFRQKHILQEIPDGNIVLVPISGKEEHEEKR